MTRSDESRLRADSEPFEDQQTTQGRRPANKIGRRKTLQMKQRTRDIAQLIDCIKKRINPCALEGLCLEIKNLISSTAFLSRKQK
ncbi:hypothetical protein CHARACLAT_021561 [Characodon lateralis]|uniref:Uncharacterized protein n=1 Tax=Characodon lateralis TaxID=208331 RepID=A0ABU7D321_9TELE|nr:hypothetical protein [Characodon lateralis]